MPTTYHLFFNWNEPVKFFEGSFYEVPAKSKASKKSAEVLAQNKANQHGRTVYLVDLERPTSFQAFNPQKPPFTLFISIASHNTETNTVEIVDGWVYAEKGRDFDPYTYLSLCEAQEIARLIWNNPDKLPRKLKLGEQIENISILNADGYTVDSIIPF